MVPRVYREEDFNIFSTLIGSWRMQNPNNHFVCLNGCQWQHNITLPSITIISRNMAYNIFFKKQIFGTDNGEQAS